MAADGDRIQGARGSEPPQVEFEIANEFAHVIVSKVQTRNGERLSIRAPKLNREIVLCPLESESLTWQSDETFTEFLSTPFGPSNS
jgi:hypothetical protein